MRHGECWGAFAAQTDTRMSAEGRAGNTGDVADKAGISGPRAAPSCQPSCEKDQSTLQKGCCSLPSIRPEVISPLRESKAAHSIPGLDQVI